MLLLYLPGTPLPTTTQTYTLIKCRTVELVNRYEATGEPLTYLRIKNTLAKEFGQGIVDAKKKLIKQCIAESNTKQHDDLYRY